MKQEQDQPDCECVHDWYYLPEPYSETMECAFCKETQR